MSIIYDKTDKGREEIATRRHGLTPRLRPLLVMVDGKQADDALLAKVAGLGLDAGSLDELAAGGYIRLQDAAAPVAVEPPAAAVPETPAATESDSGFLAVYHFYNETIRSTIGLRGYGLQLRVEKAATLDELRQLRQPFLEGVAKARGQETAESLRARLDALLGASQGQPATLAGTV